MAGRRIIESRSDGVVNMRPFVPLAVRAPPAERDADPAQATWAHLGARLLGLEESWRRPPREVS